jgi:transcriptional regulator with XRE-family HTH domain
MSVDEARQLADRLRETREYLNLSQQYVSEQTGIPRSAISDIERGGRRVESLELKRLANLYGVAVSYFLDDESAAGDEVAAVMTRLMGEMGEREREELLRFANYLRHSNRRGRRA